MRLLTFILAVLLLAGTVEPTRGWLIALVVLASLAVARPRFGWLFNLRPNLDPARVATLVLAVLLLAGTIDPTRDWLIALTASAGVAAFMPRVFGAPAYVDGFDDWPWGGPRGGRGRSHRWSFDWDGDDWR